MKIKAQPLKRQQLLTVMRHACGVAGVMALISWATMGVETSAQVALSFWRGEVLAQRLAQALGRAGARQPRVLGTTLDGERLAQAAEQGWDLELQSEALTLDASRCGIAKPGEVTVHPFYGVGTLGCATRANLARMVSDPRDLSRPRALDGADGKAAAEAVERYQTGETRDLIDINFDN